MKQIKESIFSVKLQQFLSYPWTFPAEKTIIKTIDTARDKIVKNGEKGKDYVRQLIQKNKNILDNNCSPDFVDELNNLPNYIAEGISKDNNNFQQRVISAQDLRDAAKEQKHIIKINGDGSIINEARYIMEYISTGKIRSKAIIRLQKILDLQKQNSWNINTLDISLKDFQQNYQQYFSDDSLWSFIHEAINQNNLMTKRTNIKLAINRIQEIENDSTLDNQINESLAVAFSQPKVRGWKNEPSKAEESDLDEEKNEDELIESKILKLLEEENTTEKPKTETKFDEIKNSDSEYITPSKGGTTKEIGKDHPEGDIIFENVELWKTYIKSKFSNAKFEDEVHFEYELGDVVAYVGNDVIGKFVNGYGILNYSDFDKVEDYESKERTIDDYIDDKQYDSLKESDDKNLSIKEQAESWAEYYAEQYGIEKATRMLQSLGMKDPKWNYYAEKYLKSAKDLKEDRVFGTETEDKKFDIQKIKQFLSRFPDNAKSWSQATDEIRDMARKARELTNTEPLDFNWLKTPSEWNTKGKKFILNTIHNMTPHTKQEFYNYFKDWFEAPSKTITEDMTTGDMAVYDAPVGMQRRSNIQEEDREQGDVFPAFSEKRRKLRREWEKQYGNGIKDWYEFLKLHAEKEKKITETLKKKSSKPLILYHGSKAKFDTFDDSENKLKQFEQFVLKNCNTKGYIKEGKLDLQKYINNRPLWFKKEIMKKFDEAIAATDNSISVSVSNFSPCIVSFTAFEDSIPVGKSHDIKCHNVEEIEDWLENYQSQYLKADYVKATIEGKEIGRAVIKKNIRESIDSTIQIDDIILDNDDVEIQFHTANGKSQNELIPIIEFESFVSKKDSNYKNNYSFKNNVGNDEEESFTDTDFSSYWNNLRPEEKNNLVISFLKTKKSINPQLKNIDLGKSFDNFKSLDESILKLINKNK